VACLPRLPTLPARLGGASAGLLPAWSPRAAAAAAKPS